MTLSIIAFMYIKTNEPMFVWGLYIFKPLIQLPPIYVHIFFEIREVFFCFVF